MLTMRHHDRKALSDKQNVLNMFKSRRKAKVKSCNTGIPASCHSSVYSNNKTGEHYSVPQKTKRLKTIKQRNLIREQSTNRPNQSHQHCERGSKDKGPCRECQECQCSRSLSFCKKEKPVAKPFSLQKPSIITEGRLTSIRGLFSHEVRSVDIERLVKDKKHQKHIEKQQGQSTASNSPFPFGVIPHSTPLAVISETNEEGISACANKDLKSKMLEQTDCLQTNLEGTIPRTVQSGDRKHNSAQSHAATARPGNPSGQKGIQEAVILSSTESEPVHRSVSVKVSQSDHKDIANKKSTHDQKQINRASAAMDVQHILVNNKRLDTPVGSDVLNSDASQFEPSPAVFTLFSPTLDRERRALQNVSQHRKPVFSPKEEALSKLAARLCQDLGSFPLQRCCPLLTECRKVLLDQLQERHGSQLQHSLCRLHSQPSAEESCSPHTAEQVWPSSVQKYSHNTHLNYIRTHADDQQSKTMEFQTDNGSQKHCLQEGVYERVEREAAFKRQRKQTWGIHSPQDFVTKLQQPCQDTLGQWSVKAQSQTSLKAKEHSSSQTFFLHQAFTELQTSTPWSYNCTNGTMDPFFLEPQKQVKLGSDENRRRHSTALPLLEQWRNDPDLKFLFQDENPKRSYSSSGPLTELGARSPHHSIESVSERPLYGTSTTVSTFFPPEGFCYEPYYRFPHPSNSFTRFGTTLYTQPDVGKSGHDPSLHLSPPFF